MSLVYRRDGFHSFSTIQEHAPQGWNWCMSKAYCKWPVIVVIIAIVVFAIFTLYCCLRCCGCCGLRRRGGRGSGQATQPSMFNPVAAYQGYQPAHNPASAPPPYQNFAHFDAPSQRGVSGKVHEDSLPAMPSWESAQSRHVEDKEAYEYAGLRGTDVEMGQLKQPTMAHANPSSTNLSTSITHTRHDSYTGPDFGVAAGHDAFDTSYHGASSAAVPAAAKAEAYTGPDFTTAKPYTAYAPHASSENDSMRGSAVQVLEPGETTYGYTERGAPQAGRQI